MLLLLLDKMKILWDHVNLFLIRCFFQVKKFLTLLLLLLDNTELPAYRFRQLKIK